MNESTRSITYVQSPILYVDGLAPTVQDEEVVAVLQECLKLRLNLNRDQSQAGVPISGMIEFDSIYNAEKAYATSNHQVFPQHFCSLSLHLSPPPSEDAAPLAQPRIIKSLPRTFTAGQVFDLCREFGPIHSATLQLSPAYPPGSGPPKFKGQALVAFYEEEDAQKMTEGLHFLEVGGQNIAVALWDVKRAEKARRSDISSRSFHSPSSPSLESTSPMQNKAERTSRWAKTTSKYPSSLSANAPEFSSPVMSRNVSGASQWSNNTGETSFHEGGESPKSSKASMIDPCNLFVKSLDPSLSSQDLYSLFSPYGDIVSARVMTDPVSSRSKEFGFVSFKEASQADLARREMDGKLIRSKHVTVRLHEPKRLRESRLSGGGAGESGEDAGSSSAGGTSIRDIWQGLEHISTSDRISGLASPTPSTTAAATDGTPEAADGTSTDTKAPASEHDRLLAAVRAIDPAQTAEIVELIEGLPKKERIMCLFNPEVLRRKVEDALLVLEALKEEENDEDQTVSKSPPVDLQGNKASLSSESTADIPSSIPLFAKLPSSEIVRLLPAATDILHLSTPTESDLESTRQFMDELEGLPIGQVKQKLGEKLFKVVKKTGVKRAPKITIDLLDTEELSPLAVLLHYPEILREKALLLSTAKPTST